MAACAARGVEEGAARRVTDLLRGQQRYTFCKAHALATAQVAWREAWLRAHHPLPSWVATLKHHSGNYPLWVYVEAVKRSGVHVALPCVNQSLADWSQEVRTLRPGLSEIRGLSGESVERILDERQRGGAPRVRHDHVAIVVELATLLAERRPARHICARQARRKFSSPATATKYLRCRSSTALNLESGAIHAPDDRSRSRGIPEWMVERLARVGR